MFGIRGDEMNFLALALGWGFRHIYFCIRRDVKLNRPHRWTTTIHVRTYIYSFHHGTPEPWRRTSKYAAVSATDRCTTAAAFLNRCWIPEIHVFVPKLCRPIIYQDKRDRLRKTPTLLSSRTAPKIYEYSNSWTIVLPSCDELCCTGIFCMIHIPMRSSHNSILYTT